MNKRYLHHILKSIRKIRAWYFVVILVILGAVFILSYRQNNVTALQLRDEVLAADKANGDVESALKQLREHVYGHMNSDLATDGGAYPPVQLKYRYDRLTAVEKERVSAANAVLYTKAQGYCESVIPEGRSLFRIECIENYLTTNGGVAENAIPDALYKFDFAAPRWSPDLAGFSLLAFILVGAMFIVRTVTVMGLKLTLNE